MPPTSTNSPEPPDADKPHASEGGTPPVPTGSPAPAPLKQAVVFFDGQNLYHAAQEAFHFKEPNYDPLALADRLCTEQGWAVKQVRFYTGVPGEKEDPKWHRYWTGKLQGLRNAGAAVVQRPLRYRSKRVRLPLTVAAARRSAFFLPDGTALTIGEKLYLQSGAELPDGTELSVWVAEEKGIDVRLAIDLVRLTNEQHFDVALVFSQDQDLAEAIREAKWIASHQGRQVSFYSAFPWSSRSRNPAGVNGTTWIKIDGATYAACLDARNYHVPEPRRRR